MFVGTEQGHSRNEVEKGNRDVLGHVVAVFEYINEWDMVCYAIFFSESRLIYCLQCSLFRNGRGCSRRFLTDIYWSPPQSQ